VLGRVHSVTSDRVFQHNRPGPDLRPTQKGQYAYGELPAAVFEALKQKILAAGSPTDVVARDE